jgi:hypothetical protein
MTEIKIPFTKTRITQETDPRKPANVEALSLDIGTDFKMSQLGELI